MAKQWTALLYTANIFGLLLGLWEHSFTSRSQAIPAGIAFAFGLQINIEAKATSSGKVKLNRSCTPSTKDVKLIVCFGNVRKMTLDKSTSACHVHEVC